MYAPPGTLGVGAALTWSVRAVARSAGLRGIAAEAGCLATFAALYPWGLLAERVDPGGPYRPAELYPVQRGPLVADAQAASPPVLLVHGLVRHRSTFAVLARALRHGGFRAVHAVNYTVLTSDVRRCAAQFGRSVERVCEQAGAEQVHVVGHSLGGLVARYYVQCLGGDARVNTLVTLGTPHAGTLSAYLLPTTLVRQLRPGSDVLTELAGPAAGCATRFVSVYSELDELVVPQRSARLEHPDLDVTTLRLRALGHLSLSTEPRAVRAVVASLAQRRTAPDRPAPQGETLLDRAVS